MLDTEFGHGTHVAGILAGNCWNRSEWHAEYLGVAPDARIAFVDISVGANAENMVPVCVCMCACVCMCIRGLCACACVRVCECASALYLGVVNCMHFALSFFSVKSNTEMFDRSSIRQQTTPRKYTIECELRVRVCIWTPGEVSLLALKRGKVG